MHYEILHNPYCDTLKKMKHGPERKQLLLTIGRELKAYGVDGRRFETELEAEIILAKMPSRHLLVVTQTCYI